MQTFAEQLNAMRKERHITQEQLAQELNVSRTTISRWESGKVLPDIETIKQLSQVLNYNFFTVEGFAEEHQKAEVAEEQQPMKAEDSIDPENGRKKLVIALAVIVLAVIFIVTGISLNRAPKDTTKEDSICPLAIFAVNESVTPIVDENLGTSAPSFVYQFSVQNITTDITFTINKAAIELQYLDGSAPFYGEYGAQQIVPAFGTTEFTPGYGSLWMGSEIAARKFSGAKLTIEGVDSLGNEHSVSGYVAFDYPEE